MSKQGPISRTVWLLGLVSLCTDMASEMLYPVMPMYLQSIGFSVALIGLLEGWAEAIAGLGKGYFGRLSDSQGRRLPFVRWGYALSALSKPMMALWAWPWWVFASRTLDRLGKGLRTGARDALLAAQTDKRHKGQVFGFHRSMDTLGAVLGPLLALLFLQFFPQQYKALFVLALVPGLLAIGLTLVLRESPQTGTGKRVGLWAFANYWPQSPPPYRKLVAGLLFFALFNSSDVFLLLKIKEAGLGDAHTIGIYIAYNLAYALLAWPVGLLADRIGLKITYLAGLLVFALVYGLMAFNPWPMAFWAILALYGAYAAATEGIAKAWISNVCAPADTAAAMGTFAGFGSVAALVASTLTGWLWAVWGSTVALLCPAVAALLAALYLARLPFGKAEEA